MAIKWQLFNTCTTSTPIEKREANTRLTRRESRKHRAERRRAESRVEREQHMPGIRPSRRLLPRQNAPAEYREANTEQRKQKQREREQHM
jgi:hypothetical protein